MGISIEKALKQNPTTILKPFPWIEVVVPTDHVEQDQTSDGLIDVSGGNGAKISFSPGYIGIELHGVLGSNVFLHEEQARTEEDFEDIEGITPYILRHSLADGWMGCFVLLVDERSNSNLRFICAYRYIPEGEQVNQNIKLSV